jgi:phage terminase small subunit
MTKHLTKAEKERREAAEAAMPHRGKPKQAGKLITRDPAAKKYWERIWAGAEELEILDLLDEYTLTSLCSLLSMRDKLAVVTPRLLDLLEQMMSAPELSDEAVTEIVKGLRSCQALSGQRLKIDATILSYADKLGLTPSSRCRMAVHKEPVESVDLDADLFG